MNQLGVGGITFGIICMAVLAATLDAKNPTAASSSHRDSVNCAACHEGSAMQTHTVDFRDRVHGLAAQAERQGCLGCHEASTCDECHQDEPPAWHSELFRDTQRGSAWLDEHITIGVVHRQACLECHAQRFHVQCADCHLLTEWPL